MNPQLLIDLFNGMPDNDLETLAFAASNVEFVSPEHQASSLEALRDELAITNRGFAELLNVPLPTFERFYSGKTMMKPVHCQLLGLYLLIRKTQPGLFKELLPDAAGDRRFK